MGLFDSLRNQARDAVRDAVQGVGNKTETIVFPTVPDRYEEFTALPQAAMATPFETAAMTVIALCVYPRDPETSVRMLNFLRGPRPLNGQELSFIRDRFRAKDYVPRSYFCGATPQKERLHPAAALYHPGHGGPQQLSYPRVCQVVPPLRRRGQSPAYPVEAGKRRKMVSVGAGPAHRYPAAGKRQPLGLNRGQETSFSPRISLPVPVRRRAAR